MYTAMLAVENLLGASHDLWAVNVEGEYHEEKAGGAGPQRGTGRDAPVLPRPEPRSPSPVPARVSEDELRPAGGR